MMRAVFLAVTMWIAAVTGVHADERELVQLPPMMRDHMLTNMRDHLAALDGILLALAEGRGNDAAAIAERRLGMSSLDNHGASHMAPYMPVAMRDIGTSMHRAASRFARLAEIADLDPSPAGQRKVHAALQAITAACTGCHAAFRVH